jgi:hypothetical protein
MANLLTRLKINEVSSVPRGAGHGVKILLMKADTGATTASTALATLMSKAIELGAGEKEVTAAAKAMATSVSTVEKMPEAAQSAAVEKSLSQCVEHLAGLVPTEKRDDFLAASAAITTVKGDDTMTEADKAKMAALEKSNTELLASVAKLALDAAIGKLPADQQAYVAKAFSKADGTQDAPALETFMKLSAAEKAKKLADLKAADDNDADDVKKALALQIGSNPVVKKLNDDLTIAMEKLSTFEKADQVTAFAKRATDLGLPAEHGEVMRKAYAGDKDSIVKHELLIKGLREQVDTGALFKEFGGGGPQTAVNAYAEIRAKAEELKKSAAGKDLSIHQCVNKVMSDPANAELVARNKTESLKKMGAIAA